MVEYIEQERKAHSHAGPIVVHCYGGIGRTGVFLVSHIILTQIERHETVDVYGTTLKLRGDRARMVQTKVCKIFFIITITLHVIFCGIAFVRINTNSVTERHSN
jgi:protein tyrosine phosphatase